MYLFQLHCAGFHLHGQILHHLLLKWANGYGDGYGPSDTEPWEDVPVVETRMFCEGKKNMFYK